MRSALLLNELARKQKLVLFFNFPRDFEQSIHCLRLNKRIWPKRLCSKLALVIALVFPKDTMGIKHLYIPKISEWKLAVNEAGEMTPSPFRFPNALVSIITFDNAFN